MNERGRFIRVAATVAAGLVISSMVSANSTGLAMLTERSAVAVARAAVTALPAVLGTLAQASAMKIQDQPPPAEPPKADPQVTKTETKETTVWYVSPVWIGLIVLGAIALILMIALAVRGGGGADKTTIIRS
jgi:protein-S-isoprenylcysteine O-methyltransferase Ste14